MELREEQLGEEERPDAVDAHVRLDVLLRYGHYRHARNAGVIPKDVEFRFLGREGGSGGLNRGEVVEIEVKEFDDANGIGAFSALVDGGYDGFDGAFCLLLRAAGHVYRCTFEVEDFDELETDSGIATGYDEYFALLAGEAVFRPGGGRRERLRPGASESGSHAEGLGESRELFSTVIVYPGDRHSMFSLRCHPGHEYRRVHNLITCAIHRDKHYNVSLNSFFIR